MPPGSNRKAHWVSAGFFTGGEGESDCPKGLKGYKKGTSEKV